jgi:K+ transporter
VDFFAANRLYGMVVLGSVVLCITGGEALYADMGHFGKGPIRLSWLGLVFPALLLNYFGQTALLLENVQAAANPFYGLVPRSLLYPMVALATTATVIASQAMISGVYSLTQQAIQIGYCPRLRIVHTSGKTKGQIYMPYVNTMMMIGCLALALMFKESSRLVAACGFMETPWMPEIIQLASAQGLDMDEYSTSFYLGRESLLTSGDAKMSAWRKALFVFLSRNAWNVSTFFGIPPHRVVELGSQVEL